MRLLSVICILLLSSSVKAEDRYPSILNMNRVALPHVGDYKDACPNLDLATVRIDPDESKCASKTSAGIQSLFHGISIRHAQTGGRLLKTFNRILEMECFYCLIGTLCVPDGYAVSYPRKIDEIFGRNEHNSSVMMDMFPL